MSFEPDPNVGGERLISAERSLGETLDRALRPSGFDEFVGQNDLKSNLEIFVQAAKKRGDAMDHLLLFGPPGLGKTTLAQITARELGVSIKTTSGPVIAKAGDLAALLTNLEPRDVLFIDEIHRLPAAVEEILYPAMEDYALDLVIGEGPSARSIRIDLSPFTLVGATTRAGLLSTPLHARRVPFLPACSDAAARTYFARAFPDGDGAPRQILADIDGRVPRDFAWGRRAS